MRKYLIISLLLGSCTQSENQNSTKTYYDVAGFINQQIAFLAKNQPLTQKNLVIGEKTETIQTKDINWKNELELFLQTDLNKQSYQASYVKQETSNTIIYQLKKEEVLPVKTLKIDFDKDKNPKHIEALIQVKNYLYESEKKLSMNLEQKQLKNYKIEGWQELFVGKKKVFKIMGKIN